MEREKSLQSALDVLKRHETFIIFGHEDPHADCLGAQRALGSWLQRHGKTVHLCSKGPWDRPEINDWQEYFSSSIPDISGSSSPLSVILDCSSPDRTGFPLESWPDCPSLVIDHHAAGSEYGDFRFIDPESASTTLLIQEIIEKNGDRPTREEAEILFLGFCTDTGYFRHLEPGRAGPLEAVSRLVAAGASPGDTFRLLAGGRSLGSRRLLGRVLERAEPHFDGRLIVSWETWNDWAEVGSERDSDMIYQLLLSVAGVEAAVLVREQSDGRCVAGLRSINELNVGEITRVFGGGGHKKAAGCTINGSRSEVIELLLPEFGKRLE